ncbi:MAG: choice-of-anchor D domain-containing protein [Ignavibacteria bacterium]|nr:choice-of-anchor D domain-containing protein [Ignavibacteria bacterium]
MTLISSSETATKAPLAVVIGPDSSQFRVVSVSPAIVQPGGAVTVTVRCQPTRAARFEALLRFYGGGVIEPLETVALEACGGSPKFSMSKSDIQFGSVSLDKPKFDTLVIRNAGTGSLEILEQSIVGRDAGVFTIVQHLCSSLDAGKSASLVVRFSPLRPEYAIAELRLSFLESGPGNRTWYLSGTGRAPGLTAKSALDFGTLVTDAYVIDSIRISNVGKSPLRCFGQTLSGPDSAAFRILEPAAPIIDPGRASRIVIGCSARRAPSRPLSPDTPDGGGGPASHSGDALRASLRLTSDDAWLPDVLISLSAAVIDTAVEVTPRAFQFDTTVLHQSTSVSLNIRNRTASWCGIDTIALEGRDAQLFDLTSAGRGILGPTLSRNVQLTFHPVTEGEIRARVHIAASDVRTYDLFVPLSSFVWRYPLEARPDDLLIETVVGGSATAKTWIRNVSSTPQRIGRISWVSGDKTSYTISTPSPEMLAPGDSTRVDVTFRASKNGWNLATYGVYRDAASALYTILTLRGFGAQAPNGLDRAPLPSSLLGSPYPQPAADAAIVPFSLAASSRVTLAVHDALGRRVALLADSDLPPGDHARSLDTRALTPGVYLVALELGNSIRLTKTLVVLR